MPRSFSERLPLSRSALDRDAASRSRPIAELLAEPGARVVALHDAQVLLAPGGLRLALLEPSAVPDGADLFYLGRVPATGEPRVAAVLDDGAAATLSAAGASGEFSGLREAAPELAALDAGTAVEAVALANWHAVYGFAPASGRATEVRMSGWVRVDAETGKEFFPRTDAAIIVGITDADDRLLLGSNALWPPDRFSVLAGFVEPGESLEQAVVREVQEESGLSVADPRYLGSQPWPFPASLMLGFRARVADGASSVPHPDEEEISELRWFTRDELTAAVRDEGLRLPGAASIARAIIADWHGGDIGPDAW